MDDEMASGDMFDPDQLIFRDTYKDCMRMFVKANNALLKDTPIGLYVDIPESDFERSDYPEELGLKSRTALGENEIDFDKLCSALKSHEVKIRRQTEYIRTLERELERCDLQAKQVVEKDKVLTDEGFKYGDQVYKLDPIETILLEETYQPKTRELPKSVDLRKSFSGIRNQGKIGACTTFTMASIYEYILRKNQQQDVDLSERFIYYNARVAAQIRKHKEGEPLENEGTSFFDVIGTMGSEGICLEKLCEYSTDDVINEKPSEEAYADAKSRLVTVAKNVNLTEEDIKSALSEGYPVAVSVKLFSNFGENYGGFVNLPDDEEVKAAEDEIAAGKKYEHNHAMVICGYSDENRVFVVRNSWGKDFGDNGYCYLPYSYVTDEFLTNQACIITEVSLFSETQVKGVTTREIVQFDKLNPEVNAAIIEILIGEAKYEKNRLVKERTDLYEQYVLIEKKLVSAESRQSLFKGTSERLDWELKEVSRQKEANFEAQDKRIANAYALFKHSCIKRAIDLGIVVAVWILLGSLFRWLKNCSWEGFKTFMLTINDYLVDKGITPFRVFGTIILVILVLFGIRVIKYIKEKKAILKEHANVNEELEAIEHSLINGRERMPGIWVFTRKLWLLGCSFRGLL
jgi:C1A family cysteine protease